MTEHINPDSHKNDTINTDKKESSVASAGKSFLCKLWSNFFPFFALKYKNGAVKINKVKILISFIIFGILCALLFGISLPGDFALIGAYIGTVILINFNKISL